MSKKSIPWAEARENILSDPDVNAIYEAELQTERIREQLLLCLCSDEQK